jgi:lysophospholipase L1-like esterase
MVNRGINGETADDLLGRFDRDVVTVKPSHVMLMVGTNDAALGVSTAAYGEAIGELVARVCAHQFTPLLGLPIPSFDKWLEYRLDEYRQFLRETALIHKIKIVDFSLSLYLADGGGLNRDCFNDDVHPSKYGYQVMAAYFVRDMQSFLTNFGRNSSSFAE